MLDTAMLTMISECYTAAALTDEAKKHDFGAMNMVIIGDLIQLPPVCGANRAHLPNQVK